MNQKPHSGQDMVGEKLGNPKIQFSTHSNGIELQNDEGGIDCDDADNDDEMNPRIIRTSSIRTPQTTRRRATTTQSTRALTSSQTTSSTSRSRTPRQTVITFPIDSTSRNQLTSNNTSEGNKGLQRSFNATTFVILPILAVSSAICLVLLIIYIVRHHRRKTVVDVDETSPDYRDFSTNHSTIPLTQLDPENIVYYEIDGPSEIITSNVPSPLNQDGGIYYEIDHLQIALQKQKIDHDANGNSIQKENEYFMLEPPSRAHPYSNLSKDKNSECYDLAKTLSQITNDESMSTPEYFKIESTIRHEYQNEPPLKTDTFKISRDSESDIEKQSDNEYFTLEKCVQNEAQVNATVTETDSKSIATRAENQNFTFETKQGPSSLGEETQEDAIVTETAAKANYVSTADSEYFTLEMVNPDETKQDSSSLGSVASQRDDEYFILESINKA